MHRLKVDMRGGGEGKTLVYMPANTCCRVAQSPNVHSSDGFSTVSFAFSNGGNYLSLLCPFVTELWNDYHTTKLR